MMSACRGVLGARMGPAGADGVVPAAAGAVQQTLRVLELACITASLHPNFRPGFSVYRSEPLPRVSVPSTHRAGSQLRPSPRLDT